MHECPTCEHLCTPSWQVSLVGTVTLSLCFSWDFSPFIIFVGIDHQNCQNNSSCDPKHIILLVQRKRCLGKYWFLFYFSCLQRRYIKANKQGFFLYWYDWINPNLSQSCLSPSSWSCLSLLSWLLSSDTINMSTNIGGCSCISFLWAI